MMRSCCAVIAALVLPCPAFAQAPAPAPASVQPAYDYSIANPVAGSWRYAATSNGSAASFGDGVARPLLTLTCVRSARRISIARPALGAAPYLMVWTSAERRNVPASFNPATGLISADLGAYDRLFDSLAFSRGRLAIGPSNAGALVAPVWPDIIRVIEDCRS